MATIDIQKIREELAVFLRNEDVISAAKRGVSAQTDTFVASAGQTVFILTKPGVKNVRSVKKNAATLAYGETWEADYHSGEITLASAAAGGDSIEVSYDHGVGDKVYPDLPRMDISLESYPRVGFDDISHSSSEQALGAGLIRTDILLSMVVYSTQKDECLEIWKRCRDAIVASKKAFWHFSFITLAGAGPLAQSSGRHDKVVQKNQDFRIPFEFET